MSSHLEEIAPESTLPYPPVHTDKKFVVFSDWDGTITNFDSNDYLTDNLGFGFEARRKVNERILAGELTFRDGFRQDLESVVAKGYKFEECKKILRESIKLDEGFKEFYKFCSASDIPVIVVSSGMEPIIRAVLSNLLGEHEKEIAIISNDAEVKEDDTWMIKYRHPSSHFGHDKSQAILPYRRLPNPPFTFFFGDGVSDLSAARHADMLFVKTKPGGENDLAKYCKRENIPHVLFSDFSAALVAVKSVVSGEKTAGYWFEKGRVE
ncbi:HAD-like domain-containing protein [Vararia minispora EC-137]|uniref:HAD-like domain-containing protein n=1 Tax=Vararia minispora EC-137 TaxID=1314806 RepID=A0ACB8Q546_9AGAM|nr:HAD-like domain-containing protein [Vararia minispora EC-137]